MTVFQWTWLHCGTMKFELKHSRRKGWNFRWQFNVTLSIRTLGYWKKCSFYPLSTSNYVISTSSWRNRQLAILTKQCSTLIRIIKWKAILFWLLFRWLAVGDSVPTAHTHISGRRFTKMHCIPKSSWNRDYSVYEFLLIINNINTWYQQCVAFSTLRYNATKVCSPELSLYFSWAF